jgi:hypothetical protein
MLILHNQELAVPEPSRIRHISSILAGPQRSPNLEAQDQTATGVDQAGSEREGQVEVHVKSLVTGEKAKFPMPLAATLSDAWAEAYVRLGETRRDGDTLRCAGEDGEDLGGRLNLTLAQLREAKICKGERFEIRGPSGGA